MASAFSLSGLLRLDFDLTNTVTVGSVADTATVLETISYANGTGAGQANVYARISGGFTAGGTDEIEYTLSALSVPTQTATTYTINLAKLRFLYFKNNHATQRMRVLLMSAATPPVTYSDLEVRGKGVAVWSAGSSTSQESAIATVIVQAYDSVLTSTFDLVLAGVKA